MKKNMLHARNSYFLNKNENHAGNKREKGLIKSLKKETSGDRSQCDIGNLRGMLSIIIPVWKEAETLPRLINALVNQGACSEDIEVIIVTCPGDEFYDPKAYPYENLCFVRSKERGRASQLNYGARLAKGDILYFLHADTFPPHGFVASIHASIQEGKPCGSFWIKFDESHWSLCMFSYLFRFSTPYLRFGDQSLFVSKDLFLKTGGYDTSTLIMEGQEYAFRLYKTGSFRLLTSFVISSGRKFRQNGTLRLLIVYAFIYIMYHLGFSQNKLVSIYRMWIHGANI